jgi:tRNA (guanine37-N1)-methyltransferase
MTWRATALTLFPEMFPGPLGLSLAGRALREGRWGVGRARHSAASPPTGTAWSTTRPSAAARGMVMRPASSGRRLRGGAAGGRRAPALVYLTPRGRPSARAMVRGWAAGPGRGPVCGRYEGVDQRVIEARGMERSRSATSVLSGGEGGGARAARCLRPPAARRDGRGGERARRAFGAEGLLDYPHYTRPAEWQGRAVPEVLLSGHHGRGRTLAARAGGGDAHGAAPPTSGPIRPARDADQRRGGR